MLLALTLCVLAAAPSDPSPGATAGPSGAPESSDDGLDALVATARARVLEGDFDAAVRAADDVVVRFEAGPAFHEGDAWRAYADALVIRATALRRLNRADDSDSSLKRLIVVRPEIVPDPSIAPPKITERHADLRAALKAKPRVQIEIVSDPPGAAIVVDGNAHGDAPALVTDLLPGQHFIAFEARDGTRVERRVEALASTRITEKMGRAAVAVEGPKTPPADPEDGGGWVWLGVGAGVVVTAAAAVAVGFFLATQPQSEVEVTVDASLL